MKNLRKAYSAILFAVKLEWGSSQRECILRLQKTLECQISFLAVDFIRELIQAGPTMDAKVDPAAETHKRKMTEPLESSSKKQCVTPSVVSVASVASVAVVDKPRVLLS
jgi:hypothetical protein